MRKDYAHQNDFCPDCVNENNEVESDSIQCDDEDCCNCCCCCCSDSESGDQEENPVDSEGTPAADRIQAQKKDLLSSLSITRTNRERANIQNVLQFVEALTHSNSFLRRYNMQEDFCLECLEESVRNCFIQSLSRPSTREQCTCSSCDANDQDGTSHRMRTSADNCPDCLTAPKVTSERPRGRDRRGRRRRRRTRNSFRATPVVHIQPEIQSETPQQNSNHESGSYDSDCSECRRKQTRPISRTEERLSECEQGRSCQVDTGTRTNVAIPHNQPRYSQGNFDSCPECIQNSSYVGSKLSERCCNSNNPGDYCCVSDCEDCQSSPTEELSCECCRTATGPRNVSKNQSASKSSGGPRRGPSPPTETSDKDSASCDCDDCRDSIECSDDSCDECASPSKKSNKK